MIRKFTMIIDIGNVQEDSIPLPVQNGKAGSIKVTLTQALSGGQAIGTFKINGNKIGGKENNVSEIIDEQSHEDNNFFQVDDTVTFDLTEIKNLIKVYLSLEIEEEDDG